MPLHRKEHVKDSSNRDVYGTRAFNVSVPKYQIPKEGVGPDAAYAIVRDELLLDGNASRTSPPSARHGWTTKCTS